jgi:glycosyltransferase involved in cell wall biosynthesis
MKISIVTATLNAVTTIRETIESVLGQDHKNIEYLIIDGGSTDGTLKVINEYKKSFVKLISEPDRGIYDAMNKGIRESTGDVVCILNSDDVYANPWSLRHLHEIMVEQKVDSVFANLVFVDPQNTSKILRYYDSSRFHPGMLRYGWMPAHPTFMVKRELYEQWGLYSLDYRIAADYEMMVRLFHKAGASYAHLPEVVVKMRAGGVSTRGLRSSWILNNEIVKACRVNGLGTNLAFLALKIPAKLMELFLRPCKDIHCRR